MPFQKGKPRPAKAGRKKGSVNKVTVGVKEALTLAFEGIGGVPALVKWAMEAKKNNRAVFYQIWAKLLPTQITGENGEPIRVRFVEELIDSPRSRKASPALPDTVPLHSLNGAV